MSERRQAVLRVSPDLLVELCKSAGQPRCYDVIADALPDDAEYAGIAWGSAPELLIGIVVASARFEPVPEGDDLPFLPNPLFRVTNAAKGAPDA